MTTTAIETLRNMYRAIKAAGRCVSCEEHKRIDALLHSMGATPAAEKAKTAFRAIGWAAPRHYASVCQSMSTENVHTYLDGGELTGASLERVPAEGFHALMYRPWSIQVQECGEDGAWRMIYQSEHFMRKADALAAAARQGIDLDYVGHQADHVKGYVCD